MFYEQIYVQIYDISDVNLRQIPSKKPADTDTADTVLDGGSDALILDRERVKWSIIKPATIWFHQQQMPQPWVTWEKTQMFAKAANLNMNVEQEPKHRFTYSRC